MLLTGLGALLMDLRYVRSPRQLPIALPKHLKIYWIIVNVTVIKTDELITTA